MPGSLQCLRLGPSSRGLHTWVNGFDFSVLSLTLHFLPDLGIHHLKLSAVAWTALLRTLEQKGLPSFCFVFVLFWIHEEIKAQSREETCSRPHSYLVLHWSEHQAPEANQDLSMLSTSTLWVLRQSNSVIVFFCLTVILRFGVGSVHQPQASSIVHQTYNLDSSHSQILLCFCKPCRQVSDLYGHYITAIVLILLSKSG